MARRKPTTTYTEAVVYLRVSTEWQTESGLGREAQESACRAFAARQGWAVRSVHVDDGLSGKLPIAARPGLAAAVAESHSIGAALLVYALTRAFRSQRECWLTVEDERGEPALPLVSATEPFDLTTAFGRAAFGMLATFARLEADLASDRTVAALAAAKERGTQLGAPSMVERVVDGRREPDPAMVATVRRIRGMRDEGLSLRAIRDRLNVEGVPTARAGGRWHLRTVEVALAVELTAE